MDSNAIRQRNTLAIITSLFLLLALAEALFSPLLIVRLLALVLGSTAAAVLGVRVFGGAAGVVSGAAAAALLLVALSVNDTIERGALAAAAGETFPWAGKVLLPTAGQDFLLTDEQWSSWTTEGASRNTNLSTTRGVLELRSDGDVGCATHAVAGAPRSFQLELQFAIPSDAASDITVGIDLAPGSTSEWKTLVSFWLVEPGNVRFVDETRVGETFANRSRQLGAMPIARDLWISILLRKYAGTYYVEVDGSPVATFAGPDVSAERLRLCQWTQKPSGDRSTTRVLLRSLALRK